MARKRYNIVLDPRVVDDVKAQLGDTSFSRFTERALEAALVRRGSDQPHAPLLDRGGPRTGSAEATDVSVSGVRQRTPSVPAGAPAPPRASARAAELAEGMPRACERCGTVIRSPSLTVHPNCGGRIVPPPS